MSQKYNGWLKFEGRQCGDRKHEAVHVRDGEKTIYILNYNRRPSGIKKDAIVFIAAGIQDVDGKPHQVIIGRGILKPFDGENSVRTEWVKEYWWMEHHNWYLVLKVLEVLDGERCNGLFLDQVFKAIGSDTYPTAEGRDLSLTDLRQKHTQKMHLRITDKAVDYINTELDKLFQKYGSKVYRSEL